METVSLPSSLKTKIFHFLCVMTFFFFFIWDRLVSPFSFFRNLLFLTFIFFHLTWIYFILTFLYEVKMISKLNKEKLDKFFNFCITFSFTTFIMFWLMFLSDPNSVLEKGHTIPLPLNMFIHGGVYVTCLLEQLIFNKRKTQNKMSVLFIICFICLYTIILRGIYNKWGYMIYPFVKEKILQFLITVIGATIISLVGHLIYLSVSIPMEEKLLDEEMNEKIDENKQTPSLV
jgi:hypothetical protein